MLQRRVTFSIVVGLFVAFLTLAGGFGISASAQQPVVEKLVLDDTIQPVTADELSRAITRANADGAQALLVELDTPGGLVDSMRTMAGAILGSRVPVIVYVGPSGARAGSAGFFLLEAADVAAMAPGTEAGAAHVVFEVGKPDATEMQKVENDAEAFLRSYVTRRNRNAEAARPRWNRRTPTRLRRRSISTSSTWSQTATRNCLPRSTAARSPAWTGATDAPPGRRAHRVACAPRCATDCSAGWSTPTSHSCSSFSEPCSSTSNSILPAPSFRAHWER